MATAGWYPDPSGQPGAFRYWGGDRWGETTVDHPYGPPPGGATPPPPPGGFENTAAIGPLPPTDAEGSPAPSPPPPPPPPLPPGPTTPAYGTTLPGQPGQPPTGPGGAQHTGRTGRRLGLLLLAIVATLLLGIVSFVVVRGLIEDDAGTATGAEGDRSALTTPATEDPMLDPSTAAPDPGTDDSGPGTPVEPLDPTVEQCAGGLPERGVAPLQEGVVAGGGIEAWVPGGFEPVIEQAAALTFADGVTARTKLIEQSATSGWVALYAVGGLSRANGFDDLGDAAAVVAACVTQSSSFYSGITELTELGSTEVVLDGRPAWELTHEVRIDEPTLSVEGDVLKVVVVDTGDEATYGLFLSVVPIGDRSMLEEQDAAVEAVRVP